MDGVVRQLYDFEGSNLFPRTKPSAFVSDFYDSSAEGITTIGEWIDTSVPGNYIDPDTEASVPYEPEFVYRIPREGADSDLTGDEKGTLKAVKLTQVSALHFDARLSEQLTVSFEVGQATLNKVYQAGTLLEDIIRDMLTGGATIYHVQRVFPNVNFTSVKLCTDGTNWNSITNNSTSSANVGTTPKIKFTFAFTDGQYKPVSGYTDSLFAQNNNVPVNSQYYLTDGGGHPYLITNSSTDSFSISNGVTGGNNPLAGIEYTRDLNTVTSGNKLYTITLHYTTNSNATSTPYKSNGQPDDDHLVTSGNCSTQFNFTITGVDVQVYDVEIHATPSLTVGRFWNETTNIGVEVYDRNYTASTGNANLILKSDYDINQDSSTGIWTGDSVSLFTKKALYPTWTYIGEDDEPVVVDYDGTSYPVVSPVIYYYDGMFVKQTGYPTDLFQQYNPTASTDTLYPQCNLNTDPSIGIYKGSTEVYVQQTPYSTKVAKVVSEWDEPNENTSIALGRALWFSGTSGTLINTGSTKLTDAGTYTIKFKVPHTANTIIPKKSDNTNSLVSISADTLIKASDTFTVKQEVDVKTVVDPVVAITNLTINNTSYHDGDSITLPADNKISGSITFTCSNGRFGPMNSTYTNEEFGANHGVPATNSLNAECIFSSFTAYINNTIRGTYTPSDPSAGSITGTIPFSQIPVSGSGNIEFSVTGAHGASNVQPYKRSTRESSVNIPANSALSSAAIKLTISGTAGYTITIKSSPTTAGKVMFEGGSWGTNLSQEFSSGATAKMHADPTTGKEFSHWTMDGAGSITSNPYSYTVTGAHTFVANFVNAQPKYVYLLSTDNLYSSGSTTLNVANVDEVLTQHRIANSYMIQEDIASRINENPLDVSLGTGVEQSFGYGKKWVTAIIPVAYDSTPGVHLLDKNAQEGWTLQDGTEISGIKPYSSSDSTQYMIITKRAGDGGVAVNTIRCNK